MNTHVVNVFNTVWFVLGIMGVSICLMASIILSYILNEKKYYTRKIRKLIAKYPIKIKSSKELNKYTKIKLGHYEVLNNAKQFYEEIIKIFDKDI